MDQKKSRLNFGSNPEHIPEIVSPPATAGLHVEQGTLYTSRLYSYKSHYGRPM